MCAETAKQHSLAKQKVMFLEVERVEKLGHADIARMIGYHPNSVGAWARGETEMSFGAFRELCKHIPDQHTSIMLEPVGKAIRSTQAEGCFDELAAECSSYAADHITARNDNSPGGPNIVHSEALSLVKKARAVRDAADRVITKHGAGQ